MDSKLIQSFFDSVRRNDVRETRRLLDRFRELANVRILGDATLLNEEVWVDKQKIAVGPDETRDTPALHFAVFHGHFEMAKLLIEYGADVNATAFENNHEFTPPIVLAAWEGGIEMLELLLKHGADPNLASSNGVTAISTAERHGKIARVELLKQYGADN